MNKPSPYQSILTWAIASVVIGVFVVPPLSRLVGQVSTNYLLVGLFFVFVAIIIYRAKQIARQTIPTQNVDFKKLKSTDPLKRMEWIQKNILGHDNSIKLIMKHIEQNLFLTKSGRHLGAFLIAGPPGNGKSFFAKILSEALLGKEKYISFSNDDYNQLNCREIISKKIITQYKKSPEFVLNFENIDHANTEFYQDLISLIDKGEVQDPQTNERYLLSGTIIIASSHLSAGAIAKFGTLTDYPSQINIRNLITSDGFDKNLQAHFDGVYIFGKLSPKEICTIAMIQMKRYYKTYDINLAHVGPEVLVNIFNKNKQYEDSGVCQLSLLLKNMSDPIIFEAKKQGLKTIEIEFDLKNECLKIRRQKLKAS